jgi:hypothetical protein
MSRAVAGRYGRLEVANLFPLRATNPKELLTHADPLDPHNTANGDVINAIWHADIVICA